MQIKLKVNGQKMQFDGEKDAILLWVLREKLGLTGTKYGCGIAQCGVCTVHLDGIPIRSCTTKLSAVIGKEITTIEGISSNGTHPLQKSWIEAQVPQCGYCQSGQLMQALTLLSREQIPGKEEIKAHMSGILCRCGSYLRIIRAIELALQESQLK